jgi:hypothetical protein
MRELNAAMALPLRAENFLFLRVGRGELRIAD